MNKHPVVERVEKVEGKYWYLTVDGVSAPVKDWAEKYGLPANAVKTRAARGIALSRILEPLQNQGEVVIPSADGSEIRLDRESMLALCETYGVTEQLLRARLSYGWGLEEALRPDAGEARRATCRRKTADERGRPLTFQGKTQTIGYWAKELGLKRITIKKRLLRGWSVEKTLSTPPEPSLAGRNPRDPERHTFNGASRTIPQWAKLYKLKAHLVRSRLRDGWTLEEALTTPVWGRATPAPSFP